MICTLTMFLEITAKAMSVCLIIFQGGIFDVYLVKLYGGAWASWVLADVVVLSLWILSLFLGRILTDVKRRYFTRSQNQVDGRTRPEDLPDELPFAFVAWIAYALLLAPRIVILFSQDADKLKERDFFGPNLLKISMACTPLIFIFLVQGHHDAKPHTTRRYYIERLVGGVAFDLFDSADLLEIVFQNRTDPYFPARIADATLAFAVINLFLPTLALGELRSNKFNGQVSSMSFKLIYVLCFVLLVNVPNLIIRSVIWHKYNADVSVLLMKNVMCIMLGLIELIEFANSDKPVKCNGCNKWFLPQAIHTHQQCCAKRGMPLSSTTADDANFEKMGALPLSSTTADDAHLGEAC